MRQSSWLVSLVVGAALAAGCGPDGSDPGVDPDGATQPVLTASERDALVLMREEEKLAHDVYTTLGRRWGTPIFSNIAASEQRHADAVGTLLQTYGLPDPSAGRGEGEFQDPRLQELFDALVTQGALSLVDALVVGATIEDLDIADLRQLSTQTTRPDVLAVFANLTKGSRNHLRSFLGQLTSEGGTYAPQYLDQATYDQILSTDMERGPQ